MDKEIWCVAYIFYDHWIEGDTFYETYEEAKAEYDRLLAKGEIKEKTHVVESYKLKGNNASND